MEPKWTIFIVYNLFTYLILTPLFIYWTYKYYQHKSDIVLSKRSPELTILFSILSILAYTIERPSYLFTQTHSEQDLSDVIQSDEPFWVRFIYYVAIISFACVQTSVPWILLLRYWMIYYNVCWTRETLNKGWKIHLNHLDVDHNWWLANKQKFGNVRYNLRFMAVIYLFMAVMYTALYLFLHSTVGRSLSTLISVALAIAPIIGLYVLGCKIKRFQDFFHVIQELNAIMTYTTVYIITYLIVGGLLPYLLNLSKYHRGLCVLSLSTVFSICFMYLQTAWVLNVIRGDQGLNQRLQLNSKVDEFSKSDSSRAPETEMSVSDLGSVTVSRQKSAHCAGSALIGVAIDLNKFELFMQHLSHEWSMELLLFLVEVTQLKQVIQMEYEMEEMLLNELQTAVSENKEIPLSFIVCHENIADVMEKYNVVLSQTFDIANADKMTVLKLRSLALFQKYINGNELEINISYQQRERLSSYMNSPDYFVSNVNMNPIELFAMYDEVIYEVSRLLTHSYYRFSTE